MLKRFCLYKLIWQLSANVSGHQEGASGKLQTRMRPPCFLYISLSDIQLPESGGCYHTENDTLLYLRAALKNDRLDTLYWHSTALN